MIIVVTPELEPASLRQLVQLSTRIIDLERALAFTLGAIATLDAMDLPDWVLDTLTKVHHDN